MANHATQSGQLPETINRVDLCGLTGLTDPRHRQLADAGYFPQPINGIYRFEETIKGVIRHYREMKSQSKVDLTELKKEKLAEEIKKAKIEVARLEGRMIDSARAAEFFLNVSTRLKIRAYQFLEKEMPARSGADAEGAARLSVVGRELADEMADLFAESLREWNENLT